MAEKNKGKIIMLIIKVIKRAFSSSRLLIRHFPKLTAFNLFSHGLDDKVEESNEDDDFHPAVPIRVGKIFKKAFIDLTGNTDIDLCISIGDEWSVSCTFNLDQLIHVTLAYDELDLPNEQLYAIAGHEAAHIMLHHLSARLLTFYLYLTSVLPITSTILVFSDANLMIYPISYAVVGGLFISAAFRQMEKQADCYSAEKINTASALQEWFSMQIAKDETLMTELEVDKSSLLVAEKMYSFFGTHPPLEQRIEYLEEISRQQAIDLALEELGADLRA